MGQYKYVTKEMQKDKVKTSGIQNLLWDSYFVKGAHVPKI